MTEATQIHNVRKEYWRGQIALCEASGKNQRDWCRENGICATSMSTWRNRIWREEEAEKNYAVSQEESCFVEITSKLNGRKETKEMAAQKPTQYTDTKSGKPIQEVPLEPRLMKPVAVIGYHEYMVGVYETTSRQLIQTIMEVLRDA